MPEGRLTMLPQTKPLDCASARGQADNRPGIRHGVATLPGNLRLPYAERGDPDGHPVIMLHGYTDSWRSFEPVLPYLPRSVRVIVPTLRGHGDAGRPDAGYGMDDFADDVAGLMDVLGI